MAETITNGNTQTYVGTRTIRPDGLDKVTGRARFGADFNLPGQLIGRVLRSPHPHARILSIDTSKAEALPGVKAVITRDDFADQSSEFIPAGEMMMNYKDVVRNVMAREKALYEGHAVAAVAATSAAIARRALKLIDVKYEVLPHVIDVVEAMKSGAPLLHDDLFTVGVEPKPDKPLNVAKRIEISLGDIEAGFKKADVVVEREFKTAPVHQGYIEPHAALASVSEDGSTELWCCTQGHFIVRAHCARLLGLDIGKIRVTASEIGAEAAVGDSGAKPRLDPMELRVINAAREGTKAAYGPKFGPIGLEETLKSIKKTEHWNTPLRKWQGRGVASGFWFTSGGETCASLTINEDGTVSLMAGTPDIGGLRASLSMVAADELSIPYDKVRAIIGDTGSLAFNFLTGGSRSAFSGSMAIVEAAKQIKAELCARACKLWELKPDQVEFSDGHVRALGASAPTSRRSPRSWWKSPTRAARTACAASARPRSCRRSAPSPTRWRTPPASASPSCRCRHPRCSRHSRRRRARCDSRMARVVL